MLSGCAAQGLSVEEVERSITQNSSAFQSDGGGLISSFGDHGVTVKPTDYEIVSIDQDTILWNIVGDTEITGDPYHSAPTFSASASSSYAWNDKDELTLSFFQVDDITLHDISPLHLNGIRSHVKDVIAMRITDPDLTLENVERPRNTRMEKRVEK